MLQRERCPNDNHGRSVVTVRYCPNCGETVNEKIPVGTCSEESHLRSRRAQYTYCMDCGAELVPGR